MIINKEKLINTKFLLFLNGKETEIFPTELLIKHSLGKTTNYNDGFIWLSKQKDINLFKNLLNKRFNIIYYVIEDDILYMYKLDSCSIHNNLSGGKFGLNIKKYIEIYDIENEQLVKDKILVKELRQHKSKIK